MAWRVASSLETLREQINVRWPNRSKAADGAIGDELHATTNSDHNPHVKDGAIGIVTARDFTHDPAQGPDSEALAESLRASRDPRIKYIISNKKICSGDAGPAPWAWRTYTGKNAHNHHVHLSVKPAKALYDSVEPWKLDGIAQPSPQAGPAQAAVKAEPVLRQGSKDEDAVKHLQFLLNGHQAGIKKDGDFGPATKAAVVAFQKANGLIADGVVGFYTWEALKGK